MKIKTVIFDIGGVLVELGRIRFFEQFGFAPEVCARLEKCTFGSESWKEFDLGNLSDSEIIDLFVKETPALETEIRTCMKDVHGIVRRMDSAIPWIRELQAGGRKVLYLSNYSMKVARENEDAMDFLPFMDGGLMSCDCHVIKPDPVFYQMLLDKYDLNPAECVFLDDRDDNLETARKLGIRTILVRDHEQAAADLAQLLEES